MSRSNFKRAARPGRALLLAAGCGFESVIGVELAPAPQADALLFFYNPFREEVCRKALANIERAYGQRPRNLVVAYRNPVHAQVFDEAEFLRPVVRNRIFNLYQSGGPEKLVPAAPV